jgi:hypothetical protein
MKSPAISVLVSLALFLVLCAGIALLAFMYLTDQAPADAIDNIQHEGKHALYRFRMIETLSPAETTQLYQRTCTRRCHGKDVIEKGPRTAAEWDAVVSRMKAPDRADLNDRLAAAITRHLQNHFLSNVPTVLPPTTMKYVKQHLWRSDFGESDLFLDIIYVPGEHVRLVRYLGVRNLPPEQRNGFFVVYINTHQGRVPRWDLAGMSSLRINQGASQRAISWEVLYEDGQQHHHQGMLTFPDFDVSQSTELEITMHLAGLGTRTFQWKLPIPPLPE